MKTDPKKLLDKHEKLTQSLNKKVATHVQRQEGEWYINTITLEGYDIPFRFKRKKLYKNLKGARVNLSYYPTTEIVAGLEIETMNVVRIKIA